MKRNILITGASGNLGKAAVEKFAGEGYQVIATVSPGKTLGYEAGASVTVYEADLCKEKEVEAVIRKIITAHKSIDAAILTVGGYAGGNIENTDGEAIRKMIALNFYTAYFVARQIFQHMVHQGSGRIVFIGARPALKAVDGKKNVAYALSKSLLFKLAEILNAEATGKDIVTSVIVPSTIDTPANRKAMPNARFSDWVTAEEIAEAMYYLVTEKGKSLREPVLKIYGNS